MSLNLKVSDMTHLNKSALKNIMKEVAKTGASNTDVLLGQIVDKSGKKYNLYLVHSDSAKSPPLYSVSNSLNMQLDNYCRNGSGRKSFGQYNFKYQEVGDKEKVPTPIPKAIRNGVRIVEVIDELKPKKSSDIQIDSDNAVSTKAVSTKAVSTKAVSTKAVSIVPENGVLSDKDDFDYETFYGPEYDPDDGYTL